MLATFSGAVSGQFQGLLFGKFHKQYVRQVQAAMKYKICLDYETERLFSLESQFG